MRMACFIWEIVPSGIRLSSPPCTRSTPAPGCWCLAARRARWASSCNAYRWDTCAASSLHRVFLAPPANIAVAAARIVLVKMVETPAAPCTPHPRITSVARSHGDAELRPQLLYEVPEAPPREGDGAGPADEEIPHAEDDAFHSYRAPFVASS